MDYREFCFLKLKIYKTQKNAYFHFLNAKYLMHLEIRRKAKRCSLLTSIIMEVSTVKQNFEPKESMDNYTFVPQNHSP